MPHPLAGLWQGKKLPNTLAHSAVHRCWQHSKMFAGGPIKSSGNPQPDGPTLLSFNFFPFGWQQKMPLSLYLHFLLFVSVHLKHFAGL